MDAPGNGLLEMCSVLFTPPTPTVIPAPAFRDNIKRIGGRVRVRGSDAWYPELVEPPGPSAVSRNLYPVDLWFRRSYRSSVDCMPLQYPASCPACQLWSNDEQEISKEHISP